MSLFLNVFCGAGIFAGVRAYALGLQGRPLLDKLGGYAVFVTIGAISGYGYNRLVIRSEENIERRYQRLIESREKRRALESE